MELASTTRAHRAVLVSHRLFLGERWVALDEGVIHGGPEGVVRLTPTEARLLRALIADHASPKSAAELLTQVWGRSSDTRVVHTTVGRLRAKLDPKSAPHSCIQHHLSGYVLPVRTPPPTVAGRALLSGSCYGREADLEALRQAGLQHRLVVLTGVGGVGKTRLAAEHVLLDTLDTCWVALAGRLTTEEAVLRAVGEALGVPLVARDEVDQIARALLAIAPIRLVLDSCEDAMTALPPLLATWLGAVPALRVLVTSRRALELPGAHTLRLSPLSLTSGEDGDGPALRMLRERAIATRANVCADVNAAVAMRTIAQVVDGLPLAIELAARRVAVLSVEELARRLSDDATHVLTDPSSSLARVLDAACDQLPSAGRDVLCTLAALPNSVDVRMLERLCGADTTLGALQDLVQRHLVERDHDGRFSLLNLTRAYALRHVEPEWRRACRRRAAAELAATLDVERFFPFDGPRTSGLLAWVASYTDTLVAALNDSDPIAHARLRVRVAIMLTSVARLRGPVRTARTLAREILNATIDPTERARLLVELGLVAEVAGDLQEAAQWFAQVDGPVTIAAAARVFAARIVMELGDVHEGSRWTEGDLDAALVGPALVAFRATIRSACDYYLTGDMELFASRQQHAADTLASQDGMGRFEAAARLNLASMLTLQGHLADAEREYVTARRLFVGAGDEIRAALAQTQIGHVQAARGEWAAAAQSFESSAGWHVRLGDRRWTAVAQGHQAIARWWMATRARDAHAGQVAEDDVVAAIRALEAVADARQRTTLLVEWMYALSVVRPWEIPDLAARGRHALVAQQDVALRNTIDALDALSRLRVGRDEGARAALAGALAVLESAGARTDAQRIHGLLREFGIDLPTACEPV